MSAVVTDTKNLSEKEAPVYVCIAVLLSCLVLSLTMDSYLIPFLFLLSIGMAILYNLGTNVFLGQISYITKALSAVLQLGVTMDYSIFLWHSYQEQQQTGTGKKDAMAKAIAATITSVVGSSITTVAGFLALCFMSFTLGLDLGIVMAKGVVFGVIASCFRQGSGKNKAQGSAAGAEGNRRIYYKALQGVCRTFCCGSDSGSVRLYAYEGLL